MSSCSSLFWSAQEKEQGYANLKKFATSYKIRCANFPKVLSSSEDSLTKSDLKKAYLYNEDSTRICIYLILLKLYAGHLQYCHQEYDLYENYRDEKGASYLILKELFTTPTIIDTILMKKGDMLFPSGQFYRWILLQEKLLKDDKIKAGILEVKKAEAALEEFLKR